MVSKHWTAQLFQEIGNQAYRFAGGFWKVAKEIGAAILRFVRWLFAAIGKTLTYLVKTVLAAVLILFRYLVDAVMMAILTAAVMFCIHQITEKGVVNEFISNLGTKGVVSALSLLGAIGIAIILNLSKQNIYWGWNISYTIAGWFLLLGFNKSLSPLWLLSQFDLYQVFLIAAAGFAAILGIIAMKEMWLDPSKIPGSIAQRVRGLKDQATPAVVQRAL